MAKFKPKHKDEDNLSDKKDIPKQHDINYIVITAPDTIQLSTKVNNYLETFKYFVPLGGVCFSSDNGENYFCQAMYNRERNIDG